MPAAAGAPALRQIAFLAGGVVVHSIWYATICVLIRDALGRMIK